MISHVYRRRQFLQQIGAGATAGVAAQVARHAEARTVDPVDPEDIIGSPRWPGDGFRASDFRNRFHDLGELLEISRQVPNDVAGYLTVWQRARAKALARARALDGAARRVSAGDAYFQASIYAGREYVLYLRMANIDQARASYREQRELFERGIVRGGASLPYEAVRVPYGSTTLRGIFVAGAGPGPARRPVVYRTGGVDSCKENSFMTMVWAPFTDRGVSCLLLDAPGQGEALNEQSLGLIPDYERAVSAAIDYLVSRPDVDPSRVGVYSQSTGGYFGARAAAKDRRIAAVVLQGACYDLLADCYDYCPSFRRHLRYLVGANTDADARATLSTYNLRGLAAQITAPVSVVHGLKDDGVRFAGAEQLFAEIGSRDKRFQPLDASRGLGESAADTVQGLLDWICVRLSA
jgi:fermentation-respiration switch protein FrsA (DUF1100 family)